MTEKEEIDMAEKKERDSATASFVNLMNWLKTRILALLTKKTIGS